MELAKVVCVDETYKWLQGTWSLKDGLPEPSHPVEEKLPYHVVAYAYGVKRNNQRMLVARGCR